MSFTRTCCGHRSPHRSAPVGPPARVAPASGRRRFVVSFTRTWCGHAHRTVCGAGRGGAAAPPGVRELDVSAGGGSEGVLGELLVPIALADADGDPPTDHAHAAHQ